LVFRLWNRKRKIMAQEQAQYKGIVARLTALQVKITQLNAFRGALWIIGLFLLAVGMIVGMSYIAWPSIAVRIVADLIGLIALGAAVYFWVVRALLDRPGFVQLARLLEQKYGKFQSRLIAALELHDIAIKNRENYSLELIDKTIEEAGGVIGNVDINAVINYKSISRALSRTGIIFALIVIALLLKPQAFYETWLIYSHPGTSFDKPAQFALTIKPSSGEYYRNMDMAVEAIPNGKTPRHVDLYYKFEDGGWASEAMTKADTATSFAYTFKKIKRSVDIYAKSGRIESRREHIEIVDPPRLSDISLKFEYPEYSGLPNAQSNPNDGNVSALKGTKVYIEATANKPIADCYQLFSDSSKSDLKVDQKHVTGTFSIKDNGRYTLMLHDMAARQNPEPIWYDIQALDDYPPTIDIKFPGVDVDLDEHMTLPLRISIADDYGLGKLNLVYWVHSGDQDGEVKRESIPINDKKSLDQEVDYSWDVQPLSPLPGDLIFYYCEVCDNDIVSGPKWSKSKTYSARLPNLDEILADVQDSQDRQTEGLDEALKNQQDLQKQVEQLAKDMQKSNDVNWEKQQDTKKALEKQQDIAKNLEKLAQQMQENLQKLEDNKLIGEQIAEKMEQIQQLLDQVAPPELKEAMQKLQEALDKMDPNLLKKALEQFQMTSKQLLENLDRAVSLLQKMAVEQKMDMLAKMAQKILEEQNKINEDVKAAANDSSALAKKAPAEENTSKEFDALKEQFNQLKQMDQNEQMIPPDQKSQADKEVNNQEIPPDFKDMKAGMCNNSGGMCQNKGKELSKNLQQVADALANAQKSMQQQQKQEIAKKMQKAAEDLLYLSGQQETVLDSTAAYKSTGDGLRKMAGNQMEIQSASSRVADVVSDLSKQSIFINMALMSLLGQSLSDMGNAMDRLDKRLADPAIQSEQSAMSNLNKTVFLLLQAKKNAMKSGSGSGMEQFMEQMQKMSQCQSGINQQTLSLMPHPGMALSMQQQELMGQLGAQQEMLRQQLQEMNDQFGKQGDMLGRLDQLGEEMKKVVDDLDRKDANRQTIDRQQQILSHMLDAQKSVHREDFSKKRQAEVGQDIVRKSPTLDDMGTDENSLSAMIKKALEEQYPRQYEKLIRAYFKSFQDVGSTQSQEGAPVDKQQDQPQEQQ
jgi:hypothetical protein